MLINTPIFIFNAVELLSIGSKAGSTGLYRRRRRGRPRKPRILGFPWNGSITWIPLINGLPAQRAPPVYLEADEYEAYRLVYYLGLTQEDAASRMGVSRGTLWRLLESARRKIGFALDNLAPIVINPPRNNWSVVENGKT
jgi:predicted DNA-binding protein (UPF0251 family)